MMKLLLQRTTSFVAGIVARALILCCPWATRPYYFWYRNQTVRHPHWIAPIRWEPTVKLRNGILFRVPFAEVHGMSITLKREYEPELAQKISQHLHDGDLFIDVGANMGYFTLLASQIVGDKGLVIAIEPSPSNLHWLTYNIAANKITNVLVLSMALANESGIKHLTVAPSYNNGVSNLRPDETGEVRTPTWVQPFDELSELLAPTDRVTLVKIDTEGLEIEVLRGMTSILSSTNKRLAIACELSPKWFNVQVLADLLSNAGFGGCFFAENEWVAMNAHSIPTDQTNAWFQRA